MMVEKSRPAGKSTEQQPGNNEATVAALEQAVKDYLQWMASSGYAQSTQQGYGSTLAQFLSFVRSEIHCWEDIFTSAAIDRFKKGKGQKTLPAVLGLSRYLYRQGKIHEPVSRSKAAAAMPALLQDYLLYKRKCYQIPAKRLQGIQRVVCAFLHYLAQHEIKLKTLRVEHIDAFLAKFNALLAPGTCRLHRSRLRQFLTYLHHQRGILKRDLAPLIVGPPLYALAKPPRFLREDEIKRLFAAAKFDTAGDLRTYAMLQLAYTLGLRPREIGLITLDDINFSQGQLQILDRKSNSPVKLPLPEQTLKAIAAYIVGGRANSSHRTLFLDIAVPHNPVKPNTVSRSIAKLMRAAGLSSTTYWLRHTYAQNLLESGASIFEIKQMMGHDRIQSTKRYLHIHTKMMREVLFDETL